MTAEAVLTVPVVHLREWWVAFAPGIVLLLAVITQLVLELTLPYVRTNRGAWVVPLISSLFVLWAGVEAVKQWGRYPTLPVVPERGSPVLAADNLTLLFVLLLLLILLMVTLMSHVFNVRIRLYEAEYYPLLFLSVFGMVTLAYSRDLVVTFIAIEMLSLPLYVLVGLNVDYLKSGEAALKYFLLGAFASGFLVMGIALLYGTFGTLNYQEMAAGTMTLNGPAFLMAGVALVLMGFAFKIALVPFHVWVPDVYQGSPSVVTGFMATGVKAALFYALISLFAQTMADYRSYWVLPVAAFGALTMVVGNLMAIPQTSLKRLLAYSSVVHAGYLTVGLVVPDRIAWGYIWFYLVAYALAVLGSFLIVSYLEPEGKGDVSLDDIRGLARTNPYAGYAMTIFMVSLAGLPISMGFFGKLFLFVEAVHAGWTWFVVLALVASVFSVYYYLKVIVAMFMDVKLVETEAYRKPSPSRLYDLVYLLTLVGTLIFGVVPGPVVELVREAFIRIPL